MSESSFLLGKRSGDFLALDVARRSHPSATDYWDGNWLATRVTVQVGGFRGTFDADFRTTDFEGFKSELVELRNVLQGEARFETLENQLKIEVVGDGLGHFEALCRAEDEPSMGNRLTFKMTFDQTEIPQLVEGLTSITSAFPTVGQGED